PGQPKSQNFRHLLPPNLLTSPKLVTRPRLVFVLIWQLCDRRASKTDLIRSRRIALDLGQRPMAAHRGDLLCCSSALCQPTKGSLAQTVRHTPRGKACTLGGRRD